MTKRERIAHILRTGLGENLSRCWSSFRNGTYEYMQEQHGESGATRFEVLAAYIKQESEMRDLLTWFLNATEGKSDE